jgi:hypothetical protein
LASGGLFWFVKIAVDSIAQREAKKSPLETGKEDYNDEMTLAALSVAVTLSALTGWQMR